MDFFDHSFQKRILGIPHDAELDKENKANFNEYYTGLNHPYESCYAKYNQHYINSHFLVKIPKELLNLKLKINLEENSQQRQIQGYQSTIKIKKSNGLVFSNKYDFIDRGQLDNEYFLNFAKKSMNLEMLFLKNEKIKENSFLIFSPVSSKLKNGVNYEENLGWGALDIVKLNNYSIVVYSTALPGKENIDFKNTVCKIVFSEKIEDIQLGFADKPNYFKGKSHE